MKGQVLCKPNLPAEHLDRAMDVLSRASRSGTPDRRGVEDEVLSILYATGLAHNGSETGRLWLEISEESPSHKAIKRWYLSIGRAKNPIARIMKKPQLASELSAQLRSRWQSRWRRQGKGDVPPVRKLSWNDLGEEERNEVREACAHLARYHGSLSLPGRPQRNEVDTALHELAEVFLRFTGQPIAVHDVPYAENGHFVQFSLAVLEPIALSFECTAKAISERWRRTVREERRYDAAWEAEFAAAEPTPTGDTS